MKMTATLLMFLVLLLPNTSAEDYTQMNLPEGAVARIGKGYLKRVQYSPDPTRLAIKTSIGIWLYDPTTYREVALLPPYSDYLWNVAFSPDGKMVAGWSANNLIYLWDAKTGEQKGTLTGHTNAVKSVAFSPDGATLASGSADFTVRLWDIETGEIKRTLTEHKIRVRRVLFSPDGATPCQLGYEREPAYREDWGRDSTVVGCRDR